MVDEHDFAEAGDGEADAAEHSHADFLPDDLKNVAELDLVQADTADDRDAGLRAGVAARVHQHRDERRQTRKHAQRVFKACDDQPCERC